MRISFHGAARTVTGSKHIIHLQNKKILLDCGMFQGMGTETHELNQHFGFDPQEIDVVVISHAHTDHIGLLPKLVKEGFSGKIYATEATCQLTEIMLKDSAHIQESDARYVNKHKSDSSQNWTEPLYTFEDVQAVYPLLTAIDYETWTKIDEDISVLFTEAGHIIGSACVHLKLKENDKIATVTFSGDVGTYRNAILKSPAVFPQADYIIMESTYGNKIHPSYKTAANQLLEEIQKTCVENKGKIIIPAFSIGRSQELLYALNQLSLERRLPKINYYLDSPLSITTTKLIKTFPELYNKRVEQVLKIDDDPFDFPGLTMIEHVSASKALNFSKDPCLIISASGMAEAGRVQHHLANNIDKENNTIILVGYSEPSSLAGRIKAGAQRVSIFGTSYEVKAKVVHIESLSAHADYDDLCQWLSCQDPQLVKKLFLVHGEYDVQFEFSNRLLKKGFVDIHIPNLHEDIGLG